MPDMSVARSKLAAPLDRPSRFPEAASSGAGEVVSELGGDLDARGAGRGDGARLGHLPPIGPSITEPTTVMESASMDQIGTIETACRYPVKSMAGEAVDEAFVGFSGVMGDRAYAFVPTSATTKGFPWHTGREQENLVLYRPKYRQTAVSTLPVDVTASFAMAPGVNPVFPASEAFAVDVTTPGGRILPVDAAELAAELEKEGGKAVRLRFSERSLYDCRPVSLFGNATARALGDEMGRPMDRRRFRANFYADWGEDRPYREDGLVGRTLQLGERVRIAVLERDPRCKMITLDPDTGAMDAGVMRHVAQAHSGKAGVYAAVLVEGVVRKGDAIWLA